MELFKFCVEKDKSDRLFGMIYAYFHLIVHTELDDTVVNSIEFCFTHLFHIELGLLLPAKKVSTDYNNKALTE